MNNYEAPIIDRSGQHAALSYDAANGRPIPKVFVVCDRSDTPPVWGYILRQRGLIVILETSLEKALDRWSTEMPDLVVIDIDVAHQDPMELYKKFREVSVAPILLWWKMVLALNSFGEISGNYIAHKWRISWRISWL